MEQNNSRLKFYAGFILGGIFGMALLFLWGTKEGKKVAKLIAEKGELLEEDIEKKILELEGKEEEILDKNEKITPVIPAEKANREKTRKPPVKKINRTTAPDTLQKQINVTQNKIKPQTVKKESGRKFFRKAGKALSG